MSRRVLMLLLVRKQWRGVNAAHTVACMLPSRTATVSARESSYRAQARPGLSRGAAEVT